MYGSENFMLSESSRTIDEMGRDGLALRGDQHRLQQHDRDRQQGEPPQGDQDDTLRSGEFASLPAVEPPDQGDQDDRSQDQHERAAALRHRGELEPSLARRHGAGRPFDPQEHLPESVHKDIRAIGFSRVKNSSSRGQFKNTFRAETQRKYRREHKGDKKL